ncbi:Fic family protein [Hymenobacter sp. PAMC 26628]|uniref:Fic family protein n=1 Tax=Hymenobacter sp. PAMC 26628 TaxID=1484118 RepID=UPI0007704635|nr:Fic/DOC family N-terminal domain-containing protein [Hymenobacter sp. PAMC 26628]AMJ67545.1 cell filamentation protein Fic [Hymenobacter sp. PAMC 26628]
MDLKSFRAGFWQPQVGYKSFQPSPVNQTFTWDDPELNVLLEEATLKLGELNTYSELAPSIDLFIQMHVVKEATQSSRIEGTKTAMDEALMRKEDLQPERRDDWEEVHNYIDALNGAITELDRLPLSLRLLRNTHQQLMQGVRGQHKTPGAFRTSQNWVGGATLRDAAFVPPHHLDVPALMGDLEAFLHNKEARVPHLIKIAIAHYQFETIHPFLDGNGRLGRLLITLYLVSNGILRKPVLYLSDFLEKHKSSYYDNLTHVRTHNDLNRWLRFFLVAVAATCEQALSTLKRVVALRQEVDGERIHPLGRRIPQAQQVLRLFYQSPVQYARDVVQAMDGAPTTTQKLLTDLEGLGILREATGFKRNRIFVFTEYLALFEK